MRSDARKGYLMPAIASRLELSRLTRTLIVLALGVGVTLGGGARLGIGATGIARAQGPFYAAQPPTKGALYRDGPNGRYLLGGTWLYRADHADTGLSEGWFQPVAATDGWSPVSVPNAYNAGDFSSASDYGYVGWYRKDFTLPSDAFARYVPASARHWIVRFESVNYRATVWLNGRRIGSHAGAYLPFELDLSGLHAGVNQLIVRVDDRRLPTDIPSGPFGGWWTYGGLLREVYLRAVQRADLTQVQVRPLLPCPSCQATIAEQVVVRNVTSAPQAVQLRGYYGSRFLDFGGATIPAHASWTAQSTVRIIHPRLWAPGSPSLYRASLILSDQDRRTLGGYVTYSGIRSITIGGGRLELNGRRLNLRGVDLHEQSLTTGAALDPAQLAQRIGWVRQVGATVIRAHYPLNPEIQEMADRDGILIWSEIPVWRVASQYLARPAVVALAHAMLQQNIVTNQNHPSVLLWSVGNELANPPDGPVSRYIAGAAALAHQLDPTRPVAIAGAADCHPAAYAPLDVIGYNDYFGWFDAAGGATDDRDALGPYIAGLHACYPTKALFVSEFGFDGSRHGPVEERGTYEFQTNSAAYHLAVFATEPWLSGAIYWLLQDFAPSPGATGGNPRPNPPFVQKGIFDLKGNAKPLLPVITSIFKATVQIAPALRSRSRRDRVSGRAR